MANCKLWWYLMFTSSESWEHNNTLALFWPSLAICRQNTQYFWEVTSLTTDPLFCVISLILYMFLQILPLSIKMLRY
jgi:hypothetical protein